MGGNSRAITSQLITALGRTALRTTLAHAGDEAVERMNGMAVSIDTRRAVLRYQPESGHGRSAR